VRQAARLVLAELSEIEGMLRRTIRSGLTWGSGDRQLPAFAWETYRSVLALHLPQESWRWVAGAYDDVNTANWHVIELEREFGKPGPIHFEDTEWLRGPFRAVWVAMEQLERVIGPHGGVYTYTGRVSLEELEAELWPTEEEPFGH